LRAVVGGLRVTPVLDIPTEEGDLTGIPTEEEGDLTVIPTATNKSLMIRKGKSGNKYCNRS